MEEKDKELKTPFDTVRKFSDIKFPEDLTEEVDKNGKRISDGAMVSACSLVDREMTVIGCIEDVDTKNGGGRMIIEITENGEKKKFFTNDKQLKAKMSWIKENNLFPFKAKLRSKSLGKITKYYFE